MKTLAGILGILGIILTSCTSTYYATVPGDDVYSSGKRTTVTTVTTTTTTAPTPAVQAPQSNADYNNQANAQEQAAEIQTAEGDTVPQQPTYTTSETYYAPDGNVIVTEKSYYGDFDPDNYYDYAYSARINRFHSPFHHYGYYDDYYTNAYYYSNLYDDWGTSIYFGYNWLTPYIGLHYGGLGFGYGFGWGYPYYGYGFGYPGYGYGYGWGYPYYGDYWGGYCSNSWYGTGWYYNSQDGNTHNGPRDSGGRGSNHRDDHIGAKSSEPIAFGDRYERAIAQPGNSVPRLNNNTDRIRPAATTPNTPGVNNRRTATVAPSGKVVTPINKNDRFTKPGGTKAPVGKNQAPAVRTQPQKQNPAVRPQPQRQAPGNQNQRIYIAPNQQRYAKPKTYNSPNYTKPKSSQEYVSPKTERVPTQNNMRREAPTRQAPVNIAPQQQRQREAAPQQQRQSHESGSYNSGNSGRSSSGSSGGSSGSGRSSGGGNSGGRSSGERK